MDIQAIPYITTSQMVEVDRLMIEVYGIQLAQMMENAGRQLARLGTKRFLGGDPVGKMVTVLAGSGGNGGGALVSARNLHNWGADVKVILTKPVGSYSGTILHQIENLAAFPVNIGTISDLSESDIPDLQIHSLALSLRWMSHRVPIQPRGKFINQRSVLMLR
jgi:NAD(P)H-hydrate epimerase